MKKPALVEIVWIDAIDRSESCPLSEVATCRHTRLFTRHTAGYLVHQDDERVVLAHDYDPPEPDDDEPTVGKFLVIPAGWVQKIKTVRGGKQKKHADVLRSKTTPTA